jgi:hypothetical protein
VLPKGMCLITTKTLSLLHRALASCAGHRVSRRRFITPRDVSEKPIA